MVINLYDLEFYAMWAIIIVGLTFGGIPWLAIWLFVGMGVIIGTRMIERDKIKIWEKEKRIEEQCAKREEERKGRLQEISDETKPDWAKVDPR